MDLVFSRSLVTTHVIGQSRRLERRMARKKRNKGWRRSDRRVETRRTRVRVWSQQQRGHPRLDIFTERPVHTHSANCLCSRKGTTDSVAVYLDMTDMEGEHDEATKCALA